MNDITLRIKGAHFLPLAVIGQSTVFPDSSFIVEKGLVPEDTLEGFASSVVFVKKGGDNTMRIAGVHGKPIVAVLSPSLFVSMSDILKATLCSKDDEVWLISPETGETS